MCDLGQSVTAVLFVCSWLWGTKWKGEYAARLFAGLRRHLKQDFRAVLVTDQPGNPGADIVCGIDAADVPLLTRPGCLVRMRMFDAAWQAGIGAKPGERIVNVDIDAVITGDLDPLFDRDDEFTIMQGFNKTNPCPFNGSLWMFRAGERHDVWTDFGTDAHRKYRVPVHAVPDDQGWLHHKFPGAAAFSPADGVYAFKKVGWPPRTQGTKHGLPDNARIVAFPGRDPGDYPWLGWVRQHWAGGSALITPEYARENARLHDVDPMYGAEGYLWAYTVAGIALIEECRAILDYGCGKGTLGQALSPAFDVREYDPGVPGKTAAPNAADLVVALDVMEHVEPDCVDDVIGDLARLAVKYLFVAVSTKLSKRLMADGRDTHISLHDDAWWRQKFLDHGFTVKRTWNTGLRLWAALMSPPVRPC